jgi:Mechanosensitive ion channel
MVVGKVWPALRRMAAMLHPEALARVVKGVHLHLQPQDYAFLLVLGFVSYYRLGVNRTSSSNNNKSSSSGATRTSSLDDQEVNDNDSNDSKRSSSTASSEPTLLERLYVTRAVQELAQVALASYVVDILCLVLRLQHYHFPHLWDVPRVFAKTSFSLWSLRQFLHYKRSFLKRRFAPQGGGGGGAIAARSSSAATMDLVDKAVNVVCVAFMALLISDWVSVELGLAFKGAVTLGGLGTLAFTLASKDLASQLVSGLFLQAGNKMKSGEKVALGGSTGKVVKIGLTETVLRASDNTVRPSCQRKRAVHLEHRTS